ncbi:MAG: amidohydrolase, partial [Acidobacteriota bacterium]|nr:amidohydrolase [Acidobacteriota bacterium]
MPRPSATPAFAVVVSVLLPLLVAPALARAAEAEEAGEPEEWSVGAPPGPSRTITIDTTETTWSNVDVSPDGSTIVFDMLGDVFTVPITGGEARALTSGIDWSYQPRYSPTGDEIAFVSDRAGGDNLWIMNADGSEPRPVTAEPEHLV